AQSSLSLRRQNTHLILSPCLLSHVPLSNGSEAEQPIRCERQPLGLQSLCGSNLK
ncbi:hypothetical protein KUCAC02_025539, partial [Chaenocephalus aceratus]